MSSGTDGGQELRDVLRDAALESVPLIFFAYDGDGTCTLSEGSALASIGLKPGELVGTNLFDVYPPGDPIGEINRRVLQGESVRNLYPVGEIVLDTWLRPLRDDNGDVVGGIGVSVDVTDRVRAQERAELFSAFVAAAPEFIALADLDGRVSYVNPAGRRMVAMPPDVDVTTTKIPDYLTAEGLRASLTVEQPAVQEHGRWEGESTLKHWGTGRGIPVHVASFLVRDLVSDRPVAMGTVQTDISELKAAQRDVERSLDRQRALMLHLHEAQESERRRIAGEVHDDSIQAMAAVNLRLQSLRRRLEGGASAEAAQAVAEVNDAVRQTTERLRRLLFELDSPARLDQDLGDALRDHSRAVFGPDDAACQVDVDVTNEPTIPVRRVLFRIVQEALTNVRKHSGARRVEVRVCERDGGYALSVRDDGVGIPRALATSARGRPASSPLGHLGLSGMAERAESAGGWCSVRPAPEGGTLVEAWLPAWIGYAGAAGARGPDTLAVLEQTMESISEGFAAIDRRWRYVYVNQIGADILRRHDLIGKVCWEEFDFSEPVETAYRRAMAEQRPTSARVLYPDLGRWVESRVFPSPAGLSVFFRDVTDEHDLEEQAAAHQRIITAGFEIVSVLSGSSDLHAALTDAARIVAEVWALTSVEVTVHDPQSLSVRLGETPTGDEWVTLPMVTSGREVGRFRFGGATLSPELSAVADLLALRVAAER